MSFIRKIKKGNSVYLAEVENRRNEDGKVVQKHIRYLGKEIDGKAAKKVFSSEIEVKSVKQYLDYYVLHDIAQKLGITEVLGEKMKQILLLVYTQIIERKSLYKLPEYVEHTRLKELLGLEKIVDKSLYEALDALEALDFDYIEHKISEQFKLLYDDNEAIILDVTDTYFAGSRADWKARRGKEGRYDKLLQIALAVTGKYGFPITHKTYEGNINNMMIFKDLIANFALLNFNVTILDRGMICYESINDMLSLKRPIITGLKSNQKILRDFIDPLNKDDIYNPACRTKLKNTVVYVRSFDFMGGKLITIFNPAIELSQKEKAMEAEKYDPQKAKYYGYSFIFHTTQKTEKEVVLAYFDKDIVEKAFENIKSIIDINPIRHYRMDRVQAHVKICYLAYAILAYLQYKVKPLGMSANTALENLQYAYQVELYSEKENFTWKKTVALKKIQLQILDVLKCSV